MYFHAFVKIPRHPIRAAQIHFRAAAVGKCEDPTVLQKTPDDAAHADLAADSPDAGTQGAGPSNDQLNLNARLRGPVERLDDFLVQERIHLRDDGGWTARAGKFRFAF